MDCLPPHQSHPCGPSGTHNGTTIADGGSISLSASRELLQSVIGISRQDSTIGQNVSNSDSRGLRVLVRREDTFSTQENDTIVSTEDLSAKQQGPTNQRDLNGSNGCGQTRIVTSQFSCHPSLQVQHVLSDGRNERERQNSDDDYSVFTFETESSPSQDITEDQGDIFGISNKQIECVRAVAEKHEAFDSATVFTVAETLIPDDRPKISHFIRNFFGCNIRGIDEGTVHTWGSVSDSRGTPKKVLPETKPEMRVYGSIEDEFGNLYEGEFRGGMRDGRGTILYADTNDRYEGEWLNDRPHGEGKLTRGDGLGEFVGRWKSGVLQRVKEGVASVIDAGGNRYDGSFMNGKKHGNGTLTKADGEVYIGDWVNDVRHGIGSLIYPDGSRFEGRFENDKETSEGQRFAAHTFREDDGGILLASIETRNHAQSYEGNVNELSDQVLSRTPTSKLQQIHLSEQQTSPEQVQPQWRQRGRSRWRYEDQHGSDTNDDAADENDSLLESENLSPSHFQANTDNDATKKLTREKKKYTKVEKEEERRKKKEIDAILKAEAKQKRILRNKMKKEQRDLDARQRLQAKVLKNVKKQQEKHLSEIGERQKKENREKLKEIERLHEEASKRVELEMRRRQQEIDSERRKLLEFEAQQKKALEQQTKMLEQAQRKFAEQQKKSIWEHRHAEETRKAEVGRKLKSQQDAFNAKIKEARTTVKKQEKKLNSLHKEKSSLLSLSMRMMRSPMAAQTCHSDQNMHFEQAKKSRNAIQRMSPSNGVLLTDQSFDRISQERRKSEF